MEALKKTLKTSKKCLNSFNELKIHGEYFLQLVENRFWDKGLYILDEPEAALSPQRQMTLLCYIAEELRKEVFAEMTAKYNF